jgi:septum formation protein
MRLILASASPRRRELLQNLEVPFEVRTAATRELPLQAAEWLSPVEFAWYNALRKGLTVHATAPGAWVLAADTIIALEGRIFGKPSNLAQAARMLKMLSARTHAVLTAVILIDPRRKIRGFTDATWVTFSALSDSLITRYLKTVPVLDKAGAYGIQDRGDWLIKKIDGSPSNVMGLPLEKTAFLLRAFSLIPSGPPPSALRETAPATPLSEVKVRS